MRMKRKTGDRDQNMTMDKREWLRNLKNQSYQADGIRKVTVRGPQDRE